MDSPLFVLQSYVARKKDISIRDGKILFGDEYTLPEDLLTNWIAYGSDKNGSTKEYYSLKTLVFFLQNIQYQHSAYVRDAVSANIPAVRRPDRRNLISFLHSEISTCDSIDKLIPTTPVLTNSSISAQVRVTRRREDSDEMRENVKKPRLQAGTEKLKAQLAVKLSETKENCVVVEELKSLSEAMTIERIAEIKAKRLAKKRTTIISTTLEEDLAVADVETETPTSLDPGLDDGDKIRDILVRERTYRTRTIILQSTTKEFAAGIFAILKNIKCREACKKPDYKPSSWQSKASGLTAISGSIQANPEPPAYNRYDQERFTRQEETTSGFTIQTTASYHGSTIQAVISGQNTIMPPPQLPITKSMAVVATQKKKRPSTTPIVIVPNSNASLITMLNATDILQDCRFVSNDQKRASGMKRENDLLIQRRKPEGLTVPYRITDNPLRLRAEDWQRVVAVFVLGPMWQFKGWPFGGDPVSIFSKITAFHLKYDDMPLDANVGRWAVTTLNVNRTKRHLDRAALLQFWKTLDKETAQKKDFLRL